jgi:hypothetical protein
MSRLPNFFIVGAPKAATTSLYHYLDQHPQVYMSAIKEPHFFAAEVREENCDAYVRGEIARDKRALREYLSGPMLEKRFGGIVEDWQDYLRLFAGAQDQIALGEASPCYLWSPTAAERIASDIPEARILVMLRDPVDRAFSQYLRSLGVGAVHWSFREHVRRNQSYCSGQFAVDYPFLEFGLYAAQLERYLTRFGAQVWVGFYEDFRNRPLEVYQSICRFLGISDAFSPCMERRHLQAQVPRTKLIGWLRRAGLWGTVARAMPQGFRPAMRRALTRRPADYVIDPADRQYLRDYYREDVSKLAILLESNPSCGGRPVPEWLRCSPA